MAKSLILQFPRHELILRSYSLHKSISYCQIFDPTVCKCSSQKSLLLFHVNPQPEMWQNWPVHYWYLKQQKHGKIWLVSFIMGGPWQRKWCCAAVRGSDTNDCGKPLLFQCILAEMTLVTDGLTDEKKFLNPSKQANTVEVRQTEKCKQANKCMHAYTHAYRTVTFIILPDFRQTGRADSGIVEVNRLCHFEKSNVVLVAPSVVPKSESIIHFLLLLLLLLLLLPFLLLL